MWISLVLLLILPAAIIGLPFSWSGEEEQTEVNSQPVQREIQARQAIIRKTQKSPSYSDEDPEVVELYYYQTENNSMDEK